MIALTEEEKFRRYEENIARNRKIMAKQERDAKKGLKADLRPAQVLYYVSYNGGEPPWGLVEPDSVPDWCKDPDILAEMLDNQSGLSMDDGRTWFCAAHFDDMRRIMDERVVPFKKKEDLDG